MAWSEHLISIGYFTMLINIDLKMHKRCELLGWKSELRTAAQERKLHALGLGYSEAKYKGDAATVITIAEERRKAGLASPIEMRNLREIGYYGDVSNFTSNKAKFYLRHCIRDDDQFCAKFIFDGNVVFATSYEDAVRTYNRIKKITNNISMVMV